MHEKVFEKLSLMVHRVLRDQCLLRLTRSYKAKTLHHTYRAVNVYHVMQITRVKSAEKTTSCFNKIRMRTDVQSQGEIQNGMGFKRAAVWKRGHGAAAFSALRMRPLKAAYVCAASTFTHRSGTRPLANVTPSKAATAL